MSAEELESTDVVTLDRTFTGPWKPGREPISEYHADSAVTHSKLSDYRSKGAGYFAARYVAKTLERQPPTAAMLLGQLAEDVVQDRDLIAIAVKPHGMKGNTKAGKAWLEEHEPHRVVSEPDWLAARAMAEAVESNSVAQALIEGAMQQPEARGVFQLGPKPFDIQCRPDWYGEGCAATEFRPYTLDLKSTVDFAGFMRGYVVRKFSYDMQAGFINWVLESHDVAPHLHYLIAVEKEIPYRCCVVDISGPAMLAKGAVLDALVSLSGNYAAAEWPNVPEELVTLEVV